MLTVVTFHLPPLTCIRIRLISLEGPGVSRLSGLMESLAVLGLEVIPEVLHVLHLLTASLQLWPGLHRLAERLRNLTCGEDLLLVVVVESLGSPVVLQPLHGRLRLSLRGPGGLDVSPVELRPELLLLLPGPGPALPGTAQDCPAEAGLRQRVRGRLHGAPGELARTDLAISNMERGSAETGLIPGYFIFSNNSLV